MLDIEELKKFAKMPYSFNGRLTCEIEQVIDEYDAYRGYLARLIDRKGEMAFQNVETYFDIADDIRYENYPNEEKLLSVLGDMCSDYCGDDNILKALEGRENINVKNFP